MATDPATNVGFIFGGNDGLSYEELKRRRAIAAALASRQRGFPKTVGEGLTYLGESIGETIGDLRLRQMEQQQRAKEHTILTGAPPAGYIPPVSSGPPPPRPSVAPITPPPPTSTPVEPPPPAPVSDAGPAIDGGMVPGAVAAAPDVPAPAPAPDFTNRFTASYDDTTVPVPPAQPGPQDLLFNPQQAQGGIQGGPPPQADLTNRPDVSQDQIALLTAPLSPVQPPPELAQQPPGGPGGAPGPMTLPTAAVNPPVDPRAPKPGGAPPQQAAAVPPPSEIPFEGPMPDPRSQARMRAIRAIESGGSRDPYNLQGAVTKTGDRAQGAYQVMGRNVPRWSREALGYELTPEQFRANPNAQDIVFRNRFEGNYVPKYGDEGAARAWYAGEGGMKNLAAKDIHGRLTVAGYGRDFERRLGEPGEPGGGTAITVNPRERVAVALANQPPSDRELLSDALLAEVVGGGVNGRGPQTAALSRGDVASDAPDPGVGALVGGGIADTVKARRNAIANTIQRQQDPAAPPVPVAPVEPTVVPDPAATGPAPQFAQARNVGTVTDTGLVIGGPRPLPTTPSQGIAPAPDMPPSREPIPPAREQEMQAPGPPPQRPQALGPSQAQAYWARFMNNPNVSPEVQAHATRMYNAEEGYRKELMTRQENEYVNAREKWEKQNTDYEKFTREAHDRRIKQHAERLEIENKQIAAATAPIERQIKEQQLLLEKDKVAGIPDAIAKRQAELEKLFAERDIKVAEARQAGHIKLTDVQSKDVNFFRRGTEAQATLTKYGNGAVLAGLQETAAGHVPIAGRYLQSDEYKSAKDSAKDFLAIVLRKDSGAAITDGDYKLYEPIFFPQPGDSAQQIAEKAQRRNDFMGGMYSGLGSATPIADKYLEERKTRQQQQQQEQQIPDGATRTNRTTGEKQIRRNGKWEPM